MMTHTPDQTPPAAEDRTKPATDTSTPAPSGPAPGSRKAKLAKLKRDHPVLYASRHVGVAVLEVVAGLLGLSVLLRTLLPRIDWSWVPWPDLDLSWIPDITKPEWLRYLDVVYWIRRLVDLPDLSLPAWLPALAGNLKFVIPIVVGVIVATAEVQRRKRKLPIDGEGTTAEDANDAKASAEETSHANR